MGGAPAEPPRGAPPAARAPAGSGPAPIFHTPAPPRAARREAAQAFFAAHRGGFATPARALQFLDYVVTPVSGAWAFRPNGKTGTTSTLHFLFHLEFGLPLRALVQDLGGMNTDSAAAHRLAEARVFSMLGARGDGRDPAEVLAGALRLTTIRHPLDRAVSSFLYLCRAQELQSPLFADDRLRMGATTGFDWGAHPFTLTGFERFLDYVAAELPHHDARPLDSHFRPQVLNVLPQVLRPDLLGRCEDLPAFFRQIAARLERPLPPDIDLTTPRNRQDVPGRDALETPATRARVAAVYAADFDAFDYTP
ncbi:sulfotransferase family 2 domain-containing protein [Mesobacterium pallidum]|uniref:sulfotransferase family 2 domain-containing protein n=1 Tax=Mesobacterium pallidum TaxID=2872037 RepID=UPI001EE2C5B9|nr:sulfotransferase family 2 domain-containing protein [Mesobacterium pallidum]